MAARLWPPEIDGLMQMALDILAYRDDHPEAEEKVAHALAGIEKRVAKILAELKD